MKDGYIIITQTHKSGRCAIFTREEYNRAGEKHTDKDRGQSGVCRTEPTAAEWPHGMGDFSHPSRGKVIPSRAWMGRVTFFFIKHFLKCDGFYTPSYPRCDGVILLKS